MRAAGRRFLNEDPIGFHAGINKYDYALNDPIKYRDPGGLSPWSNYFKAKQLNDQLKADKQIFKMTSKFLDPFLIMVCPAAVELAEINELAFANIEIDIVLQGGSAIGLIAKYPAVIGKPQDQLLDLFGKYRDVNNSKIDSLIGQAARERPCRCDQ